LHHHGALETSTLKKDGVVKEKTTSPIDYPHTTVEEWQLFKRTVSPEYLQILYVAA